MIFWNFPITVLILISSILSPEVLAMGERPVSEDKIMSGFNISSPSFKDQEFIPVKYSCEGENINPLLLAQNIPTGTKSLALIVDDPDAPRGTFTHWVLFNIPPQLKQIEENVTPPGSLQGKKYTGPCPPPGKIHHYYFKLFALDTILDLKEGISKADLERSIQDHILAQASLVGLYKR